MTPCPWPPNAESHVRTRRNADKTRAKRVVTEILDQFGWDTEDMGAVEAARAIEPLCMLWCIPGVGKGDWSPHAFKLLR